MVKWSCKCSLRSTEVSKRETSKCRWHINTVSDGQDMEKLGKGIEGLKSRTRGRSRTMERHVCTRKESNQEDQLAEKKSKKKTGVDGEMNPKKFLIYITPE